MPGFAFEETAKILAHEELTAGFEKETTGLVPEPLAAATLAQVHRAQDRDGRPLAIKLQRPGVESVFLEDLEILREIAFVLERDEALRDQFEPVQIVDEIVQSVRRELDFTVEARTLERMRRRVCRRPVGADSPRSVSISVRDAVLTMEFVDGRRLAAREELRAANLDPERLARTFLRALFRQVFEHGTFHADPHPGNVLACAGNVVAFLDFGIVGSLDGAVRDQLLDFVHALARKDTERMIRSARDAGQVPRDVDERLLRHQLKGFLDRWTDVPLGQLSMGGLVEEFFEILHRHRIRFPPDLVLLAKALTTAEGVARELDPDLDVLAEAKPYVIAALKERYRPRADCFASRAALPASTSRWPTNCPDTWIGSCAICAAASSSSSFA